MTKKEARQARIEAEEKVVITTMTIILTKIGVDLSEHKRFWPKALQVYNKFSSLFRYVRA